jgi:HlyD family secretion protein
MKKRTRNILIGVVAIILLGVIAKSAGWIGKKPGVEVAVEKVALRNITEMVSANGKIQPEVEVKISADVSGEIVELLIKEGQKVTKGSAPAHHQSRPDSKRCRSRCRGAQPGQSESGQHQSARKSSESHICKY